MVELLSPFPLSTEQDVEDIGILKQALPYIQQYRDTVFVVKLGGELLVDEERLDKIAADVSLLFQLNVRVILIHGGGPQLSQTAERLGMGVVRSDDAWASWDGDGTLTLATPAVLDPDDCLAQMIFHEICHALVAGERALQTRDWGLENADALGCLRSVMVT